jgi:hypothetical protein
VQEWWTPVTVIEAYLSASYFSAGCTVYVADFTVQTFRVSVAMAPDFCTFLFLSYMSQ